MLNICCSGASVRAASWAELAPLLTHPGSISPAQIVELDLSDNEIQNLNGTQDFNRLGSLSLARNALRTLLPTASLSLALVHLNVSANGLRDLKAAALLPYLQCLDASENEIEDLAPVAKCYHLRSLLLSGNRISRLQGVEALVEMQRLALAGNRLQCQKELRMLGPLTQLQHLTLQDNPMTPAGSSPEAMQQLKVKVMHLVPGLLSLDGQKLPSCSWVGTPPQPQGSAPMQLYTLDRVCPAPAWHTGGERGGGMQIRGSAGAEERARKHCSVQAAAEDLVLALGCVQDDLCLRLPPQVQAALDSAAPEQHGLVPDSTSCETVGAAAAALPSPWPSGELLDPDLQEATDAGLRCTDDVDHSPPPRSPCAGPAAAAEACSAGGSRLQARAMASVLQHRERLENAKARPYRMGGARLEFGPCST